MSNSKPCWNSHNLLVKSEGLFINVFKREPDFPPSMVNNLLSSLVGVNSTSGKLDDLHYWPYSFAHYLLRFTVSPLSNPLTFLSNIKIVKCILTHNINIIHVERTLWIIAKKGHQHKLEMQFLDEITTGCLIWMGPPKITIIRCTK